jgi:mono/diheme cytochrome c family protein
MTRLMSAALWVVLAWVLAAPTGQAQSAAHRDQTPRQDVTRQDGAALFKTWCASCHGMTAQGNGALAPMLKRVPPDLTLIAAKNGGIFPSARIRRIVDGREVESHGDPEMPVWGSAFRSSKDGYTEESVRARIDAVVAYLESIQKRNAH